jgi:hypothetical protein
MTIPSKLKIIGHKYTIKKAKHLSESNGTVGTCCPNLLRIKIGINYPLPRQKEALLHEIIEALNYHLELKLEHPVLSALSEGLYQVLRDNKIRL